MNKRVTFLLFFVIIGSVVIPSFAQLGGVEQGEVIASRNASSASVRTRLGGVLRFMEKLQAYNIKDRAVDELADQIEVLQSQKSGLMQTDRGALYAVEVRKSLGGGGMRSLGSVSLVGVGHSPVLALYERQGISTIRPGFPGTMLDEDNTYYVFLKYNSFGNLLAQEYSYNRLMSAANSTNPKGAAITYAIANRPSDAVGWRCFYKQVIHRTPHECDYPERGGEWLTN